MLQIGQLKDIMINNFKLQPQLVIDMIYEQIINTFKFRQYYLLHQIKLLIYSINSIILKLDTLEFMQKYIKRYPYLQKHFSFPSFNYMQQQCIPTLLDTNQNFIVSAPTSTGKTVLFQLALLKTQYQLKQFKCVYLAPIKSLCQQKVEEWNSSFKNLKISELTGDKNDNEQTNWLNSQVIIATPEKLDSITRQSLNNLSINLLLIDQIHMLNIENRGATLEAVVTRILKFNKKVRIIAISATIANIEQVGQWLKISKQNIKVFGEQYRPVKIEKIVIGYKSHKNAFMFERILNNKLADIIKRYSDQKPCLVFCQTQKGTISACQNIINSLGSQYIITTDEQLITLTTKSKQLSNQILQRLVVGGVAFHNASLTYQDRKIIQDLFLKSYIKVICTTSTLAMGVNLPARLVIIKSTTCYRGATRGYQQYTRGEIEQIIGRAGRAQFETQGTAVIMTDYQNVKKYQSQGKLQQLDSQFLGSIKQHINAEISLRTIKSVSECVSFLQNTFLFIRMYKIPAMYGVKSRQQIPNFIKKTCLSTIEQLNNYEIIKYNKEKDEILPLQISIEIAKSYISIQTIKKLIDNIDKIQSLKTFISTICLAQQIKKYRSKLDQRKILKALNQRNKFRLNETIGTSDKKIFVLLQSFLSNYNIEDWEMRKQINQIIYFFKSLLYCLKKLFHERKLFIHSVYCNLVIKYLNKGFWQINTEMLFKQLPGLKNKLQVLKQYKISDLDQLQKLLENKEFNVMCRQNQNFSKDIKLYINNIKNIRISAKIDNITILITISYESKFDDLFKSIIVYLGNNINKLQSYRFINNKDKEIKILLKTFTPPLKLAILKEGIIGFDEFYEIDKTGSIKKILDISNQKKQVKNQRLSLQIKNVNLSQIEQSVRSKSQQQIVYNIKKNYRINKQPKDLQDSISIVKKPRKRNTTKKDDPLKLEKQIKYSDDYQIENNKFSQKKQQIPPTTNPKKKQHLQQYMKTNSFSFNLYSADYENFLNFNQRYNKQNNMKEIKKQEKDYQNKSKRLKISSINPFDYFLNSL